MTPAELHRLANDKAVEATRLVATARRLRAHAAELDGLLDPLLSISQRVWVGPAADDFENRVRAFSRQLDVQVGRLRASAVLLEVRADRARGEAGDYKARALAAQAGAAVVGLY
ncbi:MAG: hypothetical protein QNJ81_11310 [Acidimicrobiia bacterium]|nr:hypothetical protein [Acidimicrobiia bacterium]